MKITEDLHSEMLKFQKNEISEHHVYAQLAEETRSEANRQVLLKIAEDELRHYNEWKKHTQQDVKPDRWTILKHVWMSRVLGLTFSIQLMERGEESAQDRYGRLKSQIADIERMIEDEHTHEFALIQMIKEEPLEYVSSVVLGLNDALVELTGALAGFTLALQNTRLIALSGAITGVAAALSMAASEYLSTRSEESHKDPVKAAFYTGIAYILTVIVLILPYLLISNYYLALVATLIFAIIIIAFFNYYISVVKNEPFRKRFLEMAGISLGVAGLSFIIGYLFKLIIGVDL
ncbi:MAG: rubrerythrin family protein [Anaerolineae bacterium UTCFX2]|jgi:VIT1/CCC1 family predicted Fe2+/Mn2+ transporter|nr:VIT1/CCC1 transporter family protein [Anaerolineales bacterium]OQY88772.1 MAG: rubrerythrin family protein [Anaerolineae bacterium UTCFX2]